MTNSIDEFIAKNAEFKIVMAERRTSKNGRINHIRDLEDSDRTKYEFEDGTKMTVKHCDFAAAIYTPVWKI